MLKRKGFTLLELIIVVIIVAVLAGLGIPQFIKTIERAKAAEGASVLGALRGAALRYYAEYQYYANVSTTAGIAALDVGVGTLKNFDTTTANIVSSRPASGGMILSITRLGTNPAYTLYISENGTMACNGTVANCPAGYASY